MATPTGRYVITLLKKIAGKDKDIRYMAVLDLLSELNKKSFRVEVELEARLTNAIVDKLEDPCGDVTGLVVKCLSPIVKKFSEDIVVEMASKLCYKFLNVKEQRCCDIFSIALKTTISEITRTSLAQSIQDKLGPHLLKSITCSDTSVQIKCDILDILSEMLSKFGNLMEKEHLNILNALLTQLNFNQATVRTKSVSCIASLASNLSDDLLAKATARVVQLLRNKNVKPELARTNIKMVEALSRSVGFRFGPHLAETVPLLIDYCISASETDGELRGYSFQALEIFLFRCSKDISGFCNGILDLTLEYLSYNASYTDNIEEDTDDEAHEQQDDDESADEYADDEDAIWKVRSSAAKCLAAIIVSHPEMLSKIYCEACPKLIDSFREREENVKMEIFNTFIELLRQTGNVTEGQDRDEPSPRSLLKQEVPKIVRSLNRQLREKSTNTKVGAFSVLKELVVVLPNCLADHIGFLVSRIVMALTDKSSTSNLKIEALTFTRLVMISHPPSVFHPFIQALSSPVLSSIQDRYYKVAIEALRVCGELIRVLRASFEDSTLDSKPYVLQIYIAILTCLANLDQDQEVKECAISCISLVISDFGDYLQSELSNCLCVLVDRMRNEITRLPVLKVNRPLRLATLETLNSLVVAYGDQIGPSSFEVIIPELSTLISGTDLHLTTLALELCCTLMTVWKSNQMVGLTVRDKVLPQALILIRRSLLQGQAVQALQKFFTLLVHSANTSFDQLLDLLLASARASPLSGAFAKKALLSIAQCVAVVCLAAGDSKCSSTMEMLKGILKDDRTATSAIRHLALLCLGEIGRRKDLSMHANIENIVSVYFQSPFEEIKSAAAYALGNMAVGNLAKFLPFILDQIDNQQKEQYFLLHSLKEVIARQTVNNSGVSDLQDSNVEKILKLLFNHCESEEEGVRSVVSECLGKIAAIEPKKLIPALKERTTSSTAFTRATVMLAVKYSIVERPGKIDEFLYSEISTFLLLINDNDRHVRRAAVLALSTAAHYKPNLIKGLLPALLPLLYDQTIVKEDLIMTVDLGPFKLTVDDGLELRKTAFECMDRLLDNCLDQVNPSSFIVPYLLSGLDDHYDVKMPCHLILSKLADKCPSALVAVLDSLLGTLEKTVDHKPEADATKQEIDRNNDLIRSALRAIASLSRISGCLCSLRFKTLLMSIRNSSALAEMFNSVRSK